MALGSAATIHRLSEFDWTEVRRFEMRMQIAEWISWSLAKIRKNNVLLSTRKIQFLKQFQTALCHASKALPLLKRFICRLASSNKSMCATHRMVSVNELPAIDFVSLPIGVYFRSVRSTSRCSAMHLNHPNSAWDCRRPHSSIGRALDSKSKG